MTTERPDVPGEELLCKIRMAVIAERNKQIFGKHPPKGWNPRINPDRARVMLQPDYTDELVGRAALRFVEKYNGKSAPATYIHWCVLAAMRDLRRDVFGEYRSDGKRYTRGYSKNKGRAYGAYEEDGTYHMHKGGGRTLHVSLEDVFGGFHRDGTGLYHQGFPEDPAESVERSEEIQVLLACLKPRQRLVVEMRMWEGLNNAEIGRRISRTRERVRQIWYAALRRLRVEHTMRLNER